MSYQETAVEIDCEMEKFNEAKKINRFTVLSLWYHVNYCQKSPCNNCKLIIDFKDYYLANCGHSDKIICHFQQHCKQHHNEFYYLFKFLKSIAAIEIEKIKLDFKLKTLLENGL